MRDSNSSMRASAGSPMQQQKTTRSMSRVISPAVPAISDNLARYNVRKNTGYMKKALKIIHPFSPL